MSQITVQEALIHLMVAMAAADGGINETELREIGIILQTLPAFEGFDQARVSRIAQDCSALLEAEGGLDTIIGNVKTVLPQKLHETAYALAIEVAAADLSAGQPELRFLQILRDELDLDPLAAAAIERSARVRFRKL